MNNKALNEQIQGDVFMLIDNRGQALGQVSREQAFLLADEVGLDLIQVSSQNNIPVVKMLDWDKIRYKQEKQTKKQRAQQKTGEVKEIKISFSIGEHDLQTKVRQAKKFLTKGHNVKLSMRLIGRENAFAHQAREKFEKFRLNADATLENLQKKGNMIMAILKK